jgi:hypothetical protein
MTCSTAEFTSYISYKVIYIVIDNLERSEGANLTSQFIALNLSYSLLSTACLHSRLVLLVLLLLVRPIEFNSLITRGRDLNSAVPAI